MNNIYRTVAPLVSIGLVLVVASHLLAGRLSVGLLTLSQFCAAVNFTLCFLLLIVLLFLAESIRNVKLYVNGNTGQVDLAALWKNTAMASSTITGGVVVFLTVLSISGNGNLAQIYRASSTVWYDGFFWSIEKPLFHAIASSNLLKVGFWESVYYTMWVYALLVMAALVKEKRTDSYMTFAIAIVLAFYCTTVIAMLFPVAGPEYYRPGLFRYLDGSLSQQLQEYLGRYQVGSVPQNGLLYGKMSMPSLHVALTAMATWFVARHWPLALWYAVPCALLIWISTVVLAWHYAMDGVGALGMTWICLAVARKIVRFSPLAWFERKKVWSQGH